MPVPSLCYPRKKQAAQCSASEAYEDSAAFTAACLGIVSKSLHKAADRIVLHQLGRDGRTAQL